MEGHSAPYHKFQWSENDSLVEWYNVFHYIITPFNSWETDMWQSRRVHVLPPGKKKLRLILA